ncbi:transposase family protein, partial [Longicatena sp. 210702-DFI.1.199]|uniref:transposase family protein n=1 Tax=Longicatena sp. 210702-DFI.1.199 TaxID=2883223 RepID=UPI00351D8238
MIDITLVSKKFSCPSCGSSSTHVKDYKTKSITHSALNSRSCLIRYRARRFACAICGKTFFESNPFLPSRHTISSLTVLNVLNELKES